jgi:hypothetical protein
MDVASKDILARWVFPLVPDDNHPAGHVYEHSRGNKYLPKDQSVVLARSVHPPLWPSRLLIVGTQDMQDR